MLFILFYAKSLKTSITIFYSIVNRQRSLLHRCSEEAQLVALQLEREFELNGVHLPQSQRSHILDLQSEIFHLSNLYMNNLNSSTNSFKIPMSKSNNIPSSILDILNKDNKYIYLTDEV
jgi:Zn-dependent oligopeptidase